MSLLRTLTIFFLLSICSSQLAHDPYVIILGITQDGGSPHAGCENACCKSLWQYGKKEKISSIGIIDPKQRKSWMIDATPDFPQQYRKLTVEHDTELAGIFLTHAHIGHYTGLIHLGREVMGEKNVPVFVMENMEEFLKSNGPWDQLIRLKNIQLNRIKKNVNIKIGDSLFIEPFLVPHRDEYSETVGYQVTGQNNSLLYIPDIDKWNKWEQDIFKIILNIDIALLDGTFYSQNELPNRDMKEIPHPFISESMELFFDLSTTNRKKIYFIHLNHSNPTLKLNSPEWINVYEEGFNISKEGDIFRL